MDADDIINLNILLSFTQLEFLGWFESASPDDRAYSIELLALAQASLAEFSDDQIPTVDLSQASTALKKYMLNN